MEPQWTPDQPLMEAGLDSLGAVELRTALGAAKFSLDLPATVVFDHPSKAAALAQLPRASVLGQRSGGCAPLHDGQLGQG